MWWAISASICPIWSLEKPQPREDAVRQPDAFLHMPVEADAVGHPERRRLADVVQQRAGGQRHRGIAQLFEQQQRVRPHVAFRMEFRRLRDALHGHYLGQDVAQQSGLVQKLEAAPCAAFRQDARQLVADTFGRNFHDQAVQPLQRRHGGGFDLEAQPGRESHGADQAQVVFLETLVRVADGAHHAAAQVLPASREVQHLVRIGIQQQRVDRKIAPHRILPGIAFEAHRIRTPAIAVAGVAAERGHLHLGRVLAYQHDAEMRAHLLGALEQLAHAIGTRVGGHVEILRRAAQQQVAHAAAHQVGLVPRFAQPRDDRAGQSFGCHL